MNVPIKVTGRDKPVATTHWDDFGMTIRIDFELRPDGWAEVFVSNVELAKGPPLRQAKETYVNQVQPPSRP